MKFLLQRRDTWIALSALLLVSLALGNHHSRFRRSRPAMPVVASGPRSLPSVTTTTASNRTSRLEVTRLIEGGNRWLVTKGLDPFGGPHAIPRLEPPDPWAELDHWRLEAIWRQSGRSLAVLNHLVVMEGEFIAGFQLEHCDADAVWFTGPQGSRRIRISYPHASEKGTAPSPPQKAISVSQFGLPRLSP